MIENLFNIFYSIVFLIICILAIYISGFILSVVLIHEKYHSKFFWLLMPFLGISIIILMLQNLVYFDIPLIFSSIPFFLIMCIGSFTLFFITKRPLFPKFSKIIIIFTLIVIIINGFGYFIVGPSNYTGYGWIDQFNYVATSQFLIDKPISMNFDQVNNTPYLVEAIIKKNDRIGQSILHGFLAVLTFSNAKTVYGALTLISPLLTFFSLILLVPYFITNKKFQYGAAISGACIPGFASIHLQCFLSQALATPFLLITPIIINYALKEKDWRFIIIGILFFASINSIYPEFTLLFIILILCGGLWHVVQTKEMRPTVFVTATIIIIGFLINIGFIERSTRILMRGSTPNILPHIFPYAETVEGLTHLWYGYVGPAITSPKIIFLMNLSALLFSMGAFFGVFNSVKKCKSMVNFLLLIILIFPLIVLCQPEPYPYTYFKLLMTVSPVLMLGIWVLINDIIEENHIQRDFSDNHIFHRLLHETPKLLLIFLLISSIIATGFLTTFSINGGHTSLVSYIHSNELNNAYNLLENSKEQNYILSVSHPVTLAWLTYHARNNNAFFINQVMGDVPFNKTSSDIFSFNNITQFPHNAIKVPQEGYPIITPIELNNKLVALIENPQGMEGSKGNEFNWLGKRMNITMYWMGENEENVLLSYLSIPGFGYPDDKRIINHSVIEGKVQKPLIIETSGEKTVQVPFIIQPGLNVLALKNEYPEKATEFFPGDNREFITKISHMEISKLSNISYN